MVVWAQWVRDPPTGCACARRGALSLCFVTRVNNRVTRSTTHIKKKAAEMTPWCSYTTVRWVNLNTPPQHEVVVLDIRASRYAAGAVGVGERAGGPDSR